MQFGDAVRTPYVRHYYPPPPKGQPGPIWEDWKAPEKHVYVMVLIGVEPKDGSAPLDGMAALKAIGWHPVTELEKLQGALEKIVPLCMGSAADLDVIAEIARDALAGTAQPEAVLSA